MSRSLLISISEATRVGDARRGAVLMAQELGLRENDCGKVAIIATELATNLVKHAREGQLLIRPLQADGINGLELLSIDRGPGMADVSKCLADGFSTTGSPGTGLGAISRLSDLFDLFSEPGKGTVLLARLWGRKVVAQTRHLDLGAICLPMHENDACGDAWSMRNAGERTQLLLADGLGHGELAARAADEAVRVFMASPPEFGPLELLRKMQGALRATRGASVAIAEFDRTSGLVRYSGVGNISGTLHSDSGTRSMISHNGTVGHEVPRVQEFTYPWPHDATVMMHSDGLLSRWHLDGYLGLLARHPAVIAGVLFRDFQRGRDDVSVLVARGAGV